MWETEKCRREGGVLRFKTHFFFCLRNSRGLLSFVYNILYGFKVLGLDSEALRRKPTKQNDQCLQ